jgi:drug/metabolite transporter (DMT)-like permease
MDAVLLGVLAGALFGAMTVAVRFGLLRGGDPIAGAPVIAGTAFALAAAVALAAPGGSDGRALAAFFAVGLAVPGLSQVAFVSAVRHAGPSRTAIVIGVAPLLSVLLAVALLGESLDGATLMGTILIVAGGAVLAFDPGRPAGFRVLGILLALLCAALFAARDNAVRHFAVDLDAPPLDAAAASLLGATLGGLAFVVVARRRATISLARRAVAPFVPAGLLLGGAYCALVAGFDRGSVGVVAPLNATQSLWAVLIAALAYRRAEAIGRRTVIASVLVVCGGALIAAFRS